MDPQTLAPIFSTLLTGLATVLTTLSGMGLVEPFVEVALDPVRERLARRRDRQDAERELRGAVESALQKATGSSDINNIWSSYRWVNALLYIRGKPEVAARVIAAVIEMTHDDAWNVPSDLLNELRLPEKDRAAFAKFLFAFRKELAGIRTFQPSIEAADRLEAMHKLAGLYELVSGLTRVVTVTESGERAVIVKPISVDTRLVEQAYLSNLLTEFGGLLLEGRSKDEAIRPDTRLRLERVYIALNTTDARRIPLSKEDQAHRGVRDGIAVPDIVEVPLSCLRFVMETRRVMLLGDPGSGKTTFTQHLCLCLAGARRDPSSGWLGHLRAGDLTSWELEDYPLPLAIPLRLFGQDRQALPADPHQMGRAEHLLAFVVKEAARLGMNSAEEHIPSLLSNGRILLALDGLDEVTHPDPTGSDVRRREVVAQAIRHFGQRYAHARILVTCRTRQYPLDGNGEPLAAWRLPDFATARLKDLTPEQIEQFVTQWFDEMSVRQRLPSARDRLDAKRESLLQELRSNTHLMVLAGKPILLTQIVLLHAYKYLPRSRVQLYKECAELLLWDWERLRALQSGRRGEAASDYLQSLIPGLREAEVEDALDRAVFQAHSEGDPSIPKARFQNALSDLFHDVYRLPHPEAVGYAEKFILEWLESRNALLVPAEEHTFSVPHRSFREFMAGRFLLENRLPHPEDEDVEEPWQFGATRLVKSDMGKWREAIRFAAGLEVAPPEVAVALHELIPTTLSFASMDLEETILAGEMARDVGGRTLSTRSKLGRQVYDRLVSHLICLLRDTRPDVPPSYPNDVPNEPPTSIQILPPSTRLSAGELLNDLGWVPPDLSDFIEVKVGENEFWIAKYPVTNLQYQRFTEAEDYDDPEIWKSVQCFVTEDRPLVNAGENAWKWFQACGARRHRPTEWLDPRFGLTRFLFPVVGVTWYEAAAYSNWFGRHRKEHIEDETLPPHLRFRLPLESEWNVATGVSIERQRYPWQVASEQLETEVILPRMNTREAYLAGTTPVCMYPAGASPKGVMDMSGNVWEWQANLTEKDEEYRSVKGGAWYYDKVYASVLAFIRLRPRTASDYLGFRLIAISDSA